MIAAAADEMREERAGPAVTYVRNQNINVTNLCVNCLRVLRVLKEARR